MYGNIDGYTENQRFDQLFIVGFHKRYLMQVVDLQMIKY